MRAYGGVRRANKASDDTKTQGTLADNAEILRNLVNVGLVDYSAGKYTLAENVNDSKIADLVNKANAELDKIRGQFSHKAMKMPHMLPRLR
ncbi:hypothetical protein [Candidatus Nitrososphaera sp. FF02]|uniref:hypothetical protein n=1 Tax=Candidatus Nitrososphaera sp. FF02 TaxID=3398226 RepID=UPI0039ED9707